VSGKNAKAARRAERETQGISKQAVRDQQAFVRIAAQQRAKSIAKLDLPIVRRDTRRKVLASLGLFIVAMILLAFVLTARC
jgi:ribosomal protein L9